MKNKWERAQYLEPTHWLEKKDKIISIDYRAKIKDRSLNLQRHLEKYINCDSQELRILEIGGAATPLIDFFRSKNRFAIDPLAELYRREFSSVLDSDVILRSSKAEAMDFADEFFDLVIVRNVLDHVESLERVLGEMRRVVNKAGVVYVGINVFSGLLYLYRLINKDKEHPYTFSHRSIEKTLRQSGFKIIELIRDDPEQMRHFNEMESQLFFKKFLRACFLQMDCYHFSEFIMVKT